MSKSLSDLLERVQTWPKAAQDELTQMALEIEAELKAGAYTATEAELSGVDRGLRDAAEGRFASKEEVEDVFAKHRR